MSGQHRAVCFVRCPPFACPGASGSWQLADCALPRPASPSPDAASSGCLLNCPNAASGLADNGCISTPVPLRICCQPGHTYIASANCLPERRPQFFPRPRPATPRAKLPQAPRRGKLAPRWLVHRDTSGVIGVQRAVWSAAAPRSIKEPCRSRSLLCLRRRAARPRRYSRAILGRLESPRPELPGRRGPSRQWSTVPSSRPAAAAARCVKCGCVLAGSYVPRPVESQRPNIPTPHIPTSTVLHPLRDHPHGDAREAAVILLSHPRIPSSLERPRSRGSRRLLPRSF